MKPGVTCQKLVFLNKISPVTEKTYLIQSYCSVYMKPPKIPFYSKTCALIGPLELQGKLIGTNVHMSINKPQTLYFSYPGASHGAEHNQNGLCDLFIHMHVPRPFWRTFSQCDFSCLTLAR